jgi:N-acetyl-anhydromuramyl-L-alanine amidase AmpD
MTPNRIIIHHTASTRDLTLEEIRSMHMGRGWSDVGYHYYIRKDGSTSQGRKENVQGAHASGNNKDTIGICLSGDFTQEYPTTAQIRSCNALIWNLKLRYDIKDVVGHNEVGNTLCPAFDVRVVQGVL